MSISFFPPSSPSSDVPPPFPDSTFTTELVEHALRVCTDDLDVLALLNLTPGSHEGAAAVGRLLTAVPVRLVPGTPLMCLVTGERLDPQWREQCPPQPASLYSHLEFLTTLYGHCPGLSALEELEELRRRSEGDHF